MTRTFLKANQRGLFLGSDFIWEARKTLATEGKNLLVSPGAQDLFLEIFLDPKNPQIIRLALEIGLVTLFIPEFKRIRNLAQSGFYHVETMDLHSLRTVETLNEFSKGKYDKQWPLLREVLEELENAHWLFLAALLHDIGKVKELEFNIHIDYTSEGRLVGHLNLGVAMVDEKLAGLKNFPQELAFRLKHLILSHHGQYEFGSPKRPKFLEAFALHLIDDLDAKMNGIGRFMDKDQQEGAWTDFNRMFERYFLKGKLPVEEESFSIPPKEKRQGELFST